MNVVKVGNGANSNYGGKSSQNQSKNSQYYQCQFFGKNGYKASLCYQPKNLISGSSVTNQKTTPSAYVASSSLTNALHIF